MGLFLITHPAFAEDFVCHVPGNPEKFQQYLHSIDPSKVGPDCSRVSDINIPSQMELISNVPAKYLKISAGVVQEMTVSEKSAVDAALNAANISAIRSFSKEKLTGFAVEPLFLRALMDVLKDEINLMRQDIQAMSLESAQITDRTRPDRTLAQLRSAIQARIDSGSVDT